MNTTQTESSSTADSPIANAIVLEEQGFDLVKSLKLFGTELWHHLLLNIVAAVWLPRLVGPLATIISGERHPSTIWTHCGTALLLLCYGFFIGKSNKGHRVTRVLIQSSFYGCCAILLACLNPASAYVGGITVAAIAGSLAIGALIGCCFVSNKAEPIKAKKTGTKAAVGHVVGIVIAFTIGVGGIYSLMSLSTVAQRSLYLNKSAPETIFTTADGETWTFDEHKGKVILVEFWAPYCGPCVASFPELKQTHEHFSQHEDFEMVSVTSGSSEERATQMFEEKQAPWTLLFRPDEAAADDLQPYSIPAAYIIDRDGKVVAAHIRGAAVERELEKQFTE